MPVRNLVCCFLLLISMGVHAQTDSALQRIFLVGDAGEMVGGHHPQLELPARLFRASKMNTLLFLGDNIYPAGLPDSQSRKFAQSRAILDNQVAVSGQFASRIYFLPGNHDWKKGQPRGWQQLINQTAYIRALGKPGVFAVPANACPGPEEILLSEQIVLVVMDSQWWLQRYERPGTNSACECKNEAEILSSLRDIVYRNRGRLMIFATHHPLKSYGEHGGYFTLKQHIFPLTETGKNLFIPLPVIGSLYPLSRAWFGNIQDLRNPVYKSFIKQVDEVLNEHPYCLRVAGHEHSLQYILSGSHAYIVSGAGSKSSQVTYGKGSVFADRGPGFAVLEILKTGRVWLKFYSSRKGDQPFFSDTLRSFKSFNPEAEIGELPRFPDSVMVATAPYYKAGGFKRWLLGSNYRKEWTTPVKVPVFDIGKEMGGLTPLKTGGGMQSRSLRVKNQDDRQFVIRSIEKYPDKTLPEELRQTFIRDAVVDGISASYPFAALSVPVLAQAAGVPHTTPKLVYVPDDPRLGIYRSRFANGLYLFEERQPDDLKKTFTSGNVEESLEDDNDNNVDQHAVIRARILDMFMMDFDRHEDQWRWGAIDNGKGKTYFPIPRDRDQAFFMNEGIIPRIVSRPWIQPKFQGFRINAHNINTFNFNARYFDRSFLHALSWNDWQKEILAFIPKMTDSVIESALAKQPREIQPYAARHIEQVLKERRNYLEEEELEYYRFLAREVDITGSDKKEWFDIERKHDGSVNVLVYKMDKEDRLSSLIYQRHFLRNETKEIRLWGMGGKDHFFLHGSARRTIRVRIIGGRGADRYEINQTGARAGKTLVYDLATEKNKMSGNGKWRNRLSRNPEVNRFDRRAYRYNVFMPLLSATYNPDDGLYLGVQLRDTRQGFRKDPFKLMQQFRINYALATGAYFIAYNLEAIDVVGKGDLVFHSAFRAPNNTSNFFGLGNETIFDQSNGKKIRYYRTRYNMVDLSALLRFRPAPNLSMLAGPVYQHFSMDSSDNEGRFIRSGSLTGIDPGHLFENKSYTGIHLQVNYDSRDNRMFTTRGVFWETRFQSAKGTNKQSARITRLATDLSFYLSFRMPADLVIATRAGAGINFGKYEFFQAQFLGGHENLRGYRKYRFAGEKMVYHNLDLRIRLANFSGYILPGSLGVVAFHDIGRVWIDGEKSNTWHQGYGGGLWLAPANRLALTFCYAWSKDGGLPFVSLGFQF